MNDIQIQKSKKIKPIILQTLLINNLSTYRDFFRKGSNKINILNFKCPEKAIHSAKEDDFITQKRLFILIKKLKFYKTFDLKECDIRTKYIDFSKSKYMAKRMSHTKTMTFIAMRSVKAHPSTFIEKWLHFTWRVRHIDYKLILEDPYLTHMKSQKSQSYPFPLITVKNHKIKSIKIELPLFPFPLADTFWHCQSYPSSLRRLEMKGGIFNENLKPSLTLLKNLESVWFSFGNMTSVHFISNIILQLKNLPILEETRLSFSNNKNNNEIISALKSLFAEKILRKIELGFTQPIDNIEEVLNTIQGHKLKLFKLNTHMCKDKQFEFLKKLLNTTTDQLENLQLNLHLLQKCKTDKCLELICSQISQIKTLKILKFSFRLAPNNSNTKSHPELKPIFMKLFQNRISLETLSFSCNISCSKLFINMIQLINTNFLSLKKLKINTPDLATFEENEKKEFLQVIQSLHSIRVLKFPSLKITSKDLLLEIASSIQPLKFLRSLELGEMQKTITKSILIDVVQRILSKRGVEKFKFPTHVELLLALQQSVDIIETINLEDIRKLNPHIITLPDNPFIFDQNHFDRSW